MYLSAERIAVANKAIQETFEQTSIAWQTIPHWDTCDPGQTRVRKDATSTTQHQANANKKDEVEPPLLGDSAPITSEVVRFAMTVAQASAPSPDALLAAVIARTVKLAAAVDHAVLQELLGSETSTPTRAGGGGNQQGADQDQEPDLVQRILNALIDKRARLEDYGYRAPSCLITSTEGVQALSRLVKGVTPNTEAILAAANVNSLHRAKELDPPSGADYIRFLVLGRRQRIAHGGAAAASPGEEPVDLAVSVPPSLEVVGETDKGIEFAVRMRYATRKKDAYGVVVVDVHKPPATS
jgi:hypothetical protein